jgi:hypothetical protein
VPPAEAAPGAVSGPGLFARYAHGPNALGFCGPAGAEVLGRAARGHVADADVTAAARRFSGAWPYQEAIAGLAGLGDPMHPDVVRGYWVGNDLTDRLDREAFAAALLPRLRAQAGHYWPHLAEDLAAEAAPTHAFHVLGVYPWSRLLEGGRPEPLSVLESCRIGWGTVVAVHADRLTIITRRLVHEGGRLRLGPEERRSVGYLLDGEPFVAGLRIGDTVAVHWDFACDRLDERDVAHLAGGLERQLEHLAARPRGSAPGNTAPGGRAAVVAATTRGIA